MKELNIPESEVSNYILKLSLKHKIDYKINELDNFANKVTELSGDDVTLDPIIDRIVLLKRQNIITKKQLTLLTLNYLREKKQTNTTFN